MIAYLVKYNHNLYAKYLNLWSNPHENVYFVTNRVSSNRTIGLIMRCRNTTFILVRCKERFKTHFLSFYGAGCGHASLISTFASCLKYHCNTQKPMDLTKVDHSRKNNYGIVYQSSKVQHEICNVRQSRRMEVSHLP